MKENQLIKPIIPLKIETSQLNIESCSLLQCRICFQIQFQKKNSLISPCSCIGSVKLVHQECLINWISKVIDDSKKNFGEGTAFIYCQICTQKIFFKVNKVLTCNNFQQVRNAFTQKYKIFFILILLIIANLGFFSALLNYLVFVGYRTLKQNNAVLVSLIISGQVLFGIVILVAIGAIINKFLFKKNLLIQILSLVKHEFDK